MRYVSTRGSAPILGFDDVLLAGLAEDGGLYVPERWPTLEHARLEHLGTADYRAVAVEVMAPYVEPDLDRDELAELVDAAYATFDTDEVVPLVDLGDGRWLAELFHGPTLAFKDVALQLVGRMFDRTLTARGERVTIVGATSGDTGSAAIEACRDRSAIDIVILHPAGRVSDVQRRQMTTVDSPNVHNLAVEGTFDDCQDLVKALFADTAFRTRRSLSAVNSINWARVMAQVVYYVVAATRLGGAVSPVSFSVPTGNFGNVFAGWVAQRMGAPVSRLVVASNTNDILTRWLESGVMQADEVVHTLSPSMDIQVSSNAERLLFELYGRDGVATAEAMARLRAEGRLELAGEQMAPLSEHWCGARLDDDATLAVIAEVWREHAMLVDPHTAVGLGAAREVGPAAGEPIVCLATAHPAKFPDAVEAATGVRPALPGHLADLFERPEHYETIPADLGVLVEVIDRAIG